MASLSRAASTRSNGRLSRTTSTASSRTSRTDIFSDEHAVDGADSLGGLTPTDSIQDSIDFSFGDHNSSLQHTYAIPRSALPTSHNTMDRPISTSKRPLPSEQNASVPRPRTSLARSDAADTARTVSTSSRFSIPPPDEPYTGPTAPSQPYAMYPQVTRASSIASESTIRPQERPFIPQGGPEHAYGMYRNTVPEEDDDDDEESPNGIPLVFPAAGSPYQNRSRSTNNDTGDIVHNDGHVESLPPYTRYADNVVAKGDMATMNPPETTIIEEPTSSPAALASGSAMELRSPGESPSESTIARKEGWYAKSKKRRVCGIPLLAFLLVGLLIFMAAAIGGVIGGVVGTRKGEIRATSAIWSDADPAHTSSSTPSCPTGHFVIPLNQTAQVGTCIGPQNDQTLLASWDCMDFAALGINIIDAPGKPPAIYFDDYSLRPQAFRYGPQPPDFNSTVFPLEFVKDRDHAELGVALFFGHLFDKLIILPEEDLQVPGAQKRSENHGNFERREVDSYWASAEYLRVGDEPWYCFWNSTIEEFWIFLSQDMLYPGATSVDGASYVVPLATSAPSSTTPASSQTITSGHDYNSYGSQPTGESESASDWHGSNKRDIPFPASTPAPNFPKLIKMVEKRKPENNIPPYCQKMIVKPDYAVVAQPIEPICIEEGQYSISPRAKRWMASQSSRLRQRGSTSEQFESLCICEWRNGMIPS